MNLASKVAFAKVLMLAWPISAIAGPFEEGAAAHKRGDYVLAATLYQQAAEAGSVQGQYSLGSMYMQGMGVTQSFVEAARWFRSAAERGHVLAQHNIGVFYFEGRGVPQDFVEAHKWLNLAAAGSPSGPNLAAQVREKVAGYMSRSQIAEAQRLAREWKPKQ